MSQGSFRVLQRAAKGDGDLLVVEGPVIFDRGAHEAAQPSGKGRIDDAAVLVFDSQPIAADKGAASLDVLLDPVRLRLGEDVEGGREDDLVAGQVPGSIDQIEKGAAGSGHAVPSEDLVLVFEFWLAGLDGENPIGAVVEEQGGVGQVAGVERGGPEGFELLDGGGDLGKAWAFGAVVPQQAVPVLFRAKVGGSISFVRG